MSRLTLDWRKSRLTTARDSDLVNLLNKAISVAPKDPMPRLALANYQFSHARYGEAQTTINELLKQLPANADGLAAQGKINWQWGTKRAQLRPFARW